MHAATGTVTEDRAASRHPLGGSRTSPRAAVMRVPPISAVPLRTGEPAVTFALGHHAMMPMSVAADTRVPSAFTVLFAAVMPAPSIVVPLAVMLAASVMRSLAVISSPAVISAPGLISARCMGNRSG
jgi:hypothetical protein